MIRSDFNISAAPGELVEIQFEGEKGLAFAPHPIPGPDKLQDVLSETAADLEAASLAVARLHGLSEQVPSGFSVNHWVLFRPLRLREARLSSRIEDTVASSRDVALAAIERTEREEPREVQNYLAATELGSQMAGPMSEADIRALHQRLLEGLSDSGKKFPGKYRPGEVYIGDRARGFARARFVPPPAAEIPRLMQEFVQYLREPPREIPKLVATALGHYQFETIHPFADGNGRLGRMLITLSLCHYGLLGSPLLYPSAAIDRSKQEYYNTLNAVSLKGDWVGWVRYFLRVVLESAGDTLAMTRRLLELRQEYLDQFSERALSQRIVPAIDSLFEQPVLTPATLHNRIGGSDQTARNYMAMFEERGIVQRLDNRVKNPRFFAPGVLVLADED